MKNNKKGFTIVELVIVIAVIAILAAVLIPTFSNVISKANESSILQEAKSKFEEAYALDYSDGVLDGKEGDKAIVTDGSYSVVGGKAHYEYSNKGYTATYDGEKWTTGEASSSSSSN